MDPDELKDRTRSVKAPGSSPARTGGHVNGIDGLIDKMKASDAADAKMLTRFTVFIGTAGTLAAALFLLTWFFPPDGNPNIHRVVLGFMAVFFLSIGAMYRAKAREISGLDYAKPMLRFLDDAEKRYRFVNLKNLGLNAPHIVAVAGILIVSLLGWLNAMHRYLPGMSDATGIMLYCGLMLASGAVGTVLARKDWHRRKRPILEELRRLKDDLLREEAENGTSR